MNRVFYQRIITFAALTLSLIILAIFILDDTEAETHDVDASGGGDYTSIQDAIDDDVNVFPGDTLLVKEGTYTEQIDIDKQLRIFGDSADISKVIIDGDATGNTVSFSVSSIVFQNFTLKNSGDGAALIAIDGGAGSNITRCVFEVKGSGIQVSNGGRAHEVYDCLFMGENQNGIGMEIQDGDQNLVVGSRFQELSTGMSLNPAMAPGDVTNSDNTINDCVIRNNRRGIQFSEMSDPETKVNTGTDTTRNSIYGNADAGIMYEGRNPEDPPMDTVTLDTTDCWWGDATGPFVQPGNENGEGDSITVAPGEIEMTCYDPWERSPRRPATTFYVDDDGSENGDGSEEDPFKFIQDALNGSFKNDVVRVYEGTYYENIYMNRSEVKLIGNDSDEVTVDAGGEGNVLEINAGHIFLSNITFTGGENGRAGIAVNGDDNVIADCVVRDNAGNGIRLEETSNTEMRNSTIMDSGNHGIFITGNSADNEITNSTIHKCQDGVHVETGATAQDNEIHYSSIAGNSNYGILVDNEKELNATTNYWGAADGPSEKGPGSGDKVSDYVDYQPFLRKNFTDFQLIYGVKSKVWENTEYKVNYTFLNPVGDGVTWDWELDGAESFLTVVDGTSRLTLKGTPDSGDVGDYDIQIDADTDGGKSDSHAFTLSVVEVNDPPVITTTHVTDVDQDQHYSVTYEADDDEESTNELTWGWYNNDSAAFLSFEKDGNLTLWGTPDNDDVGDYQVCIWVEDYENRTHSEFTLTVNNVNDDPEITKSPEDPTDINEDEVYAFTCEGDDPDIKHGDSLTWSLESDPSTDRVTIDPVTGELEAEFRTDEEVGDDVVGLYEVTVTVEDKEEAADSIIFDLRVYTVNDKPVITIVTTQDLDEDEYYEITFTATDEEDDELQWACDIDPAADFLTFRNSNQTLYGKPGNDDVENYEVTIDIQEKDHNENTDQIIFDLNVANVNDPPEIDEFPSPPGDIDEDAPYYFDFDAQDEDEIHGDTLTWALSGNITRWLEIDEDTGEVSGTPTNDHLGYNRMEIVVKDEDEEIHEIHYLITVHNTNDPPGITITSSENDTTVSGVTTIEGTASDPDPDENDLEVEYRVDNDTWEKASGVAVWELAWNTSLVADGEYYLEFRAFDGEVYTETLWVTFLINNTVWIPEPVPNKKPTAIISSITDGAVVGETVTFDGSASSDEDGHLVLYVWRTAVKELYNGSEPTFSTSTMAAGTYPIYLRVQDNDSAWSSEDSGTLTIDPEPVEGIFPSDFDPAQNPSVISTEGAGAQESPSIHNDLMVWQDDRHGNWDIFMFDLGNPDVVQQISDSDLGGVSETHQQTQPIISGKKVIWLDEWDMEHHVRIYDLADPVFGGEELFDIGTPVHSLDFSRDWVVWTYYSDDGGIYDPYGLYTYSISTGTKKKITNLAGSEDYALYGDRLLYFTDPEDIFEENIILKVYNLTTGSIEKDLTFTGWLPNLFYPDFWGDYVVWEDHRHEDLLTNNPDIYCIDLKEETLGRITTDASPQENPMVQGDYIIWEDSRDGKSSIYAYSISQDKQAEVYSSGTNTEAVVSGEGILFGHTSSRSGQVLLYFDLSKVSSWGTSEASFSSLDGSGGGGGNGDESSAPSYYSTSNMYFLVPGGFFLLGLVVAIAGIGRAKRVSGLIAVGLVLIIFGALVGVALIPYVITEGGGEEYDEWVKSGPSPGETMRVGAFVKEKEEILAGAGYQYYLEGSDVPFLSSEDVGNEGDFIIVDITIDILGIPEATGQMSPWIFVGGGVGLIFIGMILALVGAKKAKARADTGPKTNKALKKEEKKRQKEEKKRQKEQKKGGAGAPPAGQPMPGMPQQPFPQQGLPMSPVPMAPPGMPGQSFPQQGSQMPQQPMMPPQGMPGQPFPQQGPQMPQQPMQPGVGTWACGKCGQQVDPKFSFCVFCGSARQ